MKNILSTQIFILLVSICASAQTTEFTYQGNLRDTSGQLTGSFDFEFRLYTSEHPGGTLLGAPLTRPTVSVQNGVFSVKLDFGAQFPGASRYLEISVRPTGSGAYTTLLPRQSISSSPYSVKSLNAETAANSTNAATATNALQLGGVAANQFVITTDPRMTDARPPISGSSDYVQNRTTLQALSNFNVSGSGRATFFDASQYRIGGTTMFRAPPSNIFLGNGAGIANADGAGNSFVGEFAGQSSNGNLNSFFGAGAGKTNATGEGNTFIGQGAGDANVGGSNNTMIGNDADVLSANLNFATAIGAGARINRNNQIVLGRGSGQDEVIMPGNVFANQNLSASSLVSDTITTTSLTTNTFNTTDLGVSGKLGVGNSNPKYKVHIVDPGNSGLRVQTDTVGGNVASFGGAGAFEIDSPGNPGGRLRVMENGDVGIGVFPIAKLDVFASGPAVQRIGVSGTAFEGETNIGVRGHAQGPGTNYGVSGSASLGTTNWAGHFNGNTYVGGNLGIGILTALPLSRLHLQDGFGNLAITLINNSNSSGRRGYRLAFDNNRFSFQRADDSGNFTENQMVINQLTGNVGIGNINPSDKLNVNGNVSLLLASGGGTSVCQNASFQLTTCSSSLRYKQNVNPFRSGLDLIHRLRPVAFNWKADNKEDIGLVAEEVAEVEPLLVTHNDKGEVEGVKYDRVGVVLINAVKEQQAQIETLEKRLRYQERRIVGQDLQIAEMKKALCEMSPAAKLCSP